MHKPCFRRSVLARSIAISLPLGLALPLVVSQVLAQTPANPATDLDAIIVTANKRVENVQEVPKTVLVLTPEALSKTGTSTISELGNVIPSIGGMVDNRSSTPPLRGISSFGTTVGVQSQTGVVIDDVPQAAYSSLFKELTDIESLEVLPGPQSTLSGRNASAGLINIRTREPSEIFSAEASFEHTSDRQQRMSAFMTGPLSDTVAFSLSAFSNEWGGHLRSLTEMDGNRPLRLEGWDIQGVRGKLRWQPTERLKSTLTLYTMENTFLTPGYVSGWAYLSVDPNATHRSDTLPRTIAQLYPGMSIKRYNTWTGASRHSFNQNKDRGGTLRVEYELENGTTLTSISSIAKVDMPRQDAGITFDGFKAVDLNYPHSQIHYNTETKSQELRLTSPGGQRFDYVIGAIYSDSDTWFPLQELGISMINWVRTFDMQSTAIFARGTLHAGARDDITLGLRYQDDSMGYSFAFLPARPDATVPDIFSKGDSQYDFFSAELSWRHELAQNVSTYVTASRAQSGRVYDMGNRRGAMAGVLSPLDSQEVTNFEWGLKSQWLDRRLTLNLNLFHADYDHFQIRTRPPASDLGGSFRLFTIGKVKTQGAELETRFRASERLDLNLGAAWVDAVIRDFPKAQCYIRQSAADGCNSADNTQANLRGTRMPHAPKFKITAGANYFLPLDNRPFDLEFSGAYRWQSKTMFDYRGNPNLYQDGYGILNLSATLLDREGRYSLSVFVNNVLDKNFYINMDDDDYWSGPAYYGSFGRDSFRYAGVSLKIHF